jgi:glycosyltransferase involved in cell wall biosynthesis
MCLCEVIKERLVNDYRCPPENLITVLNGVDLRWYSLQKDRSSPVRRALAIRPDEHVLVYVGRIVKRKGIDVLLQALSRISREQVSWKCIIVGDGSMRVALSEKANELGLDSSIVFVGHQEDVRPYLQAADVFVHPSYSDGLPFSVLEAMACGLPCIVGTVDGKSEVVVDGENGLLVTPGSIDELTDAIRHLLADQDARERIALNARKRAADFDIDRSMEEIKNVLLAGFA